MDDQNNLGTPPNNETGSGGYADIPPPPADAGTAVNSRQFLDAALKKIADAQGNPELRDFGKFLEFQAKLGANLVERGKKMMGLAKLFPEIAPELPLNQNPRTALAFNIKAKRKERNLSRAALADKLGISVHQLGFYERADHVPPLETLCALADFFQCSTDELLGRVPFAPKSDT